MVVHTCRGQEDFIHISRSALLKTLPLSDPLTVLSCSGLPWRTVHLHAYNCCHPNNGMSVDGLSTLLCRAQTEHANAGFVFVVPIP